VVNLDSDPIDSRFGRVISLNLNLIEKALTSSNKKTLEHALGLVVLMLNLPEGKEPMMVLLKQAKRTL
jgi:hypothetical protein